MFSSITEALNVLESRKNRRLGIEGLTKALKRYDNPQDLCTCIHIGGTNGKGSTTDFTRSILQQAGYKVGTFTSPHLISHNDRIRINNTPISDEDLLDYINKTYNVWMEEDLSMFEIDMLISLLYFSHKQVDVCIYEVGLGGRLDATNVIVPKVSAITHVDFDHMELLGDTLDKIAYEKAGIIKPSVPILTTETNVVASTVLRDVALAKQAPYIEIQVPKCHTAHNQIYFTCLGIDIVLTNQPVYQVENATLAMNIVRIFNPNLNDDSIRLGIENTHWAGRFEEIRPHVYLDGAHNMNGVQSLIDSLSLLPKPHIILFTALKDKAYSEMVSKLDAVADTLIITEFSFPRAERAENLANGHQAIVIKDYKEAINKGLEMNTGTLIITGSLYFISEARAYLLNQ